MPAKPIILHLEDDPEWVEIVRNSLKEFAVLSAHNLKDAAQVASKKHIDVAILDMSLVPGDSQDAQGERFLTALEGVSLLEGKRIVILSAYLLGSNQDRTRKYFKYFNVFDAIPKQKFDSKEFRGIIEECLKQTIEK